MKNEQCEYDNDGIRITAPGKFEGEPVFAPYFWNMALEGFADKDDGKVFTFKFTAKDFETGQKFAAELKHWLGRKRTLRMNESEQGFVNCF